MRGAKHFIKAQPKRITYAEEFGEKLHDFGSGVVSIPPVVRRHAGWTILWKPVVQEVGQQLACPSRVVDTPVEDNSNHWICQQSLISKARRWV